MSEKVYVITSKGRQDIHGCPLFFQKNGEWGDVATAKQYTAEEVRAQTASGEMQTREDDCAHWLTLQAAQSIHTFFCHRAIYRSRSYRTSISGRGE